jgi:muramoyltetrapeptide carboxypeptidase LdcA involved in peptidoglycan recycling
MKHIRYPSSLKPGEIVGVTAPSTGVAPDLEPRLQFCIEVVRGFGYEVRLGECLRSDGIVSASAQARADELTTMLLDDEVAIVVPPWGGELLINMLPLLDFARLAQAKPKWIAGYSDLSTLLMPFTMLTGIATLHGSNFMETPYQPDPALKHRREVVTLSAGDSFTQGSATRYQTEWTRYQNDPRVSEWNYSQPAQWKWLGHERNISASVTVSGRLIGGCVEVISMLPGTPYGDVNAFARDYAPEGLLFYLEVCEEPAPGACRMLHHMKLAGWFAHANAILVGRTAAPDGRNFTQYEAMADALGDLGVPVIYDMDIGHLPPQAILVNGALATVTFSPSGNKIEQRLV